MKKVTTTAAKTEVKVTLTREVLKRRNLKGLQSLSKSLNLSTSIGKTPFDREQLIENLIALGKKEAEYTPAGSTTKAALETKTTEELLAIVASFGFKPDPEKCSREALIETVLTYKGPAAVFTEPNKKKDAVVKPDAKQIKILNALNVGVNFRYPTAPTRYELISIGEGKAVIKNCQSGKLWNLKSEKELTREIVVLETGSVVL